MVSIQILIGALVLIFPENFFNQVNGKNSFKNYQEHCNYCSKCSYRSGSGKNENVNQREKTKCVSVPPHNI